MTDSVRHKTFVRMRFTVLATTLAVFFPLSLSAAQQTATVSLDGALARSLAASPRLEAAAAAMKASEGNRQQAGARPNPEIKVTAENFLGNRAFQGYDGAETTAELSQRIEIGGKLDSRKAVADGGVAMSRLDADIALLTLVSDVQTAYANAVAAHERLKMAEEQTALAEKLFDEVGGRVRAAREPQIQKSKAQITLSTARFAREKAARELEHAKHVLSSYWKEHQKDFELDTGYFFIIAPPMTEQTAETALEKSVHLQRMNAQTQQLQAVHRFEQAQAMPDPTVGLGVRDLRQTEDKAFVASLSFPLPVMNRNAGSIERARHDVARSVSEKEANRLTLINDLHEALESMTNAYENALSLRNETLPAAKEAFSQARSGYNTGKFPYLEVLDAQRTLFQVNAQYIDSLSEYHTAKATLARLTAITNENKEAAHD